jgi:Rps23 Pro-64 3,4-dihydroxylase Tpa1-like proline 4-hydroxylase
MTNQEALSEPAVEDQANPASKKAKTEDPLAPISATIISQRDKLAAEYTSNTPYPHVILPHLFDTVFLDQVVEEIKQNSSMTFKESDLFKFYQSIDLANLKSSGPVLQLRDLLYSSEWRHFMEDVAGLPRDTLADRVDCACNCHTTGCHLLCHDDVITTRCLSYILYLTEEDWTDDEGGALELYPSKEGESRKIPDPIPSKVHRPLRNHMAMFKVEPGVSFHAVQEVFGSRPRLSLQGWYHYKDPSQMDHQHMPTLQMLKQVKGEEDDDSTGDGPYESLAESTDGTTSTDSSLTRADLDYLAKYLDATYIQPSEIKQINDAFQDESAVQLQNFFRSDVIPSQEELKAEDAALKNPSYSRGVTEEWKLVGPPHMQRYLECIAGSDSKDALGSKLAHLRSEVLQSPQFGRWLAAVTNLTPPTAFRGKTRRFRPGLDYTVAHHGLLLGQNEPPVLDATMCFVVNSPVRDTATSAVDGNNNHVESPIEDEEDESWESGNVGGFECYIEADEEEGVDEEYNPADEDGTELLSVSANNNTLSLVLRDTGTMRFVKYVSSRAPSSRWDIAMEYQIPEGDDAKDSDEGGNEEEEQSTTGF